MKMAGWHTFEPCNRSEPDVFDKVPETYGNFCEEYAEPEERAYIPIAVLIQVLDDMIDGSYVAPGDYINPRSNNTKPQQLN